MFIRRRLPPLASILMIIVGILISMFVMKKMKDLYENNQKYHRMLSYRKYMDEISDYMKVVDRAANRSSDGLHRLNSALRQSLVPRVTDPGDDGR